MAGTTLDAARDLFWVAVLFGLYPDLGQLHQRDVEQNGLALCSLHHKVFDLGAFTIRPPDYVMVFSQHLFGNAEKLLSYHGSAIQLPQSSSYLPSVEFLDWHEDQVFKKPGRDAK